MEKIVIAEININVDEAIKDTQRLKEEQKKLKAETDSYKGTVKENSVEHIKAEAAYKAVSKELKSQEAIIVKATQAQNANTGSIDQLRLALSTVTGKWVRLTEEERLNTDEGKSLTAQKLQLTNALKEEEKATGDTRRQVGDYEIATKSLKSQLREYIEKLAEMKAAGQDGTEEYKKMAKQAGVLKDAMDGVNQEVKNFASDTSKLDVAIDAFKGVGAAAQIAEGSAALLGSENEDLTKSIQKMVAIQSLMNGVQEIQLLLQKESTVMLAAQAAKTKIAAAAQAIYTVAVGTSTGAMKAFRIALMATGIGAIIAGIGALVANWDKLTAAIGGSSKKLDEYNDKLEQNKKLNEANVAFDNLRVAIAKELEKSASEQTKLDLEYAKNRQKEIRAEIDLLNKKSEIKELSDEDSQKRDEAYQKLSENLDQQTILRIRLNKQLADEKEAADKAELERIEKLKEATKEYTEKLREQNERIKKNYDEEADSFLEKVGKEKEAIEQKLAIIDEAIDKELELFIEKEERMRALEEEIRLEKEERANEVATLNFENEYATLENNLFARLELERQMLDLKEAEEIKYANKIGASTLLIEKKYSKAKQALDRAEFDAKLNLAKGFTDSIAQIAGENTAIGKAAAVASTTIATIQSAVNSYNSLSGISVVGPVLGAIAAAAALASGYSQVKQILSVKSGLPGDSGVSASIPSSGGNVPSVPSVSREMTSGGVGSGIVSRESKDFGSDSIMSGFSQALQENPLQPTLVTDDVTLSQGSLSNSNKTATL